MYQKLHDAEVPNIPALGPAGDVPLSADHASTFPFAVQKTKTQDYMKGSGRRGDWCPSRPCVEPYVHYRLVLEMLGQPCDMESSFTIRRGNRPEMWGERSKSEDTQTPCMTHKRENVGVNSGNDGLHGEQHGKVNVYVLNLLSRPDIQETKNEYRSDSEIGRKGYAHRLAQTRRVHRMSEGKKLLVHSSMDE